MQPWPDVRARQSAVAAAAHAHEADGGLGVGARFGVVDQVDGVGLGVEACGSGQMLDGGGEHGWVSVYV